MALSNVALWEAVERLVALAGPAVVLGAGATTRGHWRAAGPDCGVGWRGREIPVVLPAEAQVVLGGLACDLVDDEDVRAEWLTTLVDAPAPGAVREAVHELARERGTMHGMA